MALPTPESACNGKAPGLPTEMCLGLIMMQATAVNRLQTSPSRWGTLSLTASHMTRSPRRQRTSFFTSLTFRHRCLNLVPREFQAASHEFRLALQTEDCHLC